MTKSLPHPKYLEQRYKKLSLSFKWINPMAMVLIGILSVSLVFAFRGFLTDTGLPLWIGGLFLGLCVLLWILPVSRIKFLSNYLISVQNRLYHAVYNLDKINEIPPLLESISRQKFAMKLMQFHIDGTSELKKNYGGLIQETLDWFLMVIQATENIISDELKKHKRATLQAKNEVNEISTSSQAGKGTLELQAIRLDKQVQKFEELQKVLIKI